MLSLILLGAIGLNLRSTVVKTDQDLVGYSNRVPCDLPDDQRSIYYECSTDAEETPSVAMIGDSKATALISGVIRTSQPSFRWLFIGGEKGNQSPIPLLIENPPPFYRGLKVTPLALNYISSQPNIRVVTMVMATRTLFGLKGHDSLDDLPDSPHFNLAYEAYSNSIRKIIHAGKKVVIVEDNPTLRLTEDCKSRATNWALLNTLFQVRQGNTCELSLSQHLYLSQQYRTLLTRLENENPGKVFIFHTLKHLCDLNQKICKSQENNHELYSYTDHISNYSAQKIGQDLNQFIISITK